MNIAIIVYSNTGHTLSVARKTEVCESKGATVCGWESVRWTSLRRRRDISRVVSNLSDHIESAETEP